MREVTFLQQRADDWRRLEKVANDKTADPDELAALFVEASDDLSYARTFYPASKSVGYLNDLLGRLYRALYKNRSTDTRRFALFWSHDVPAAVWEARAHLLVAFALAFVCVAIGVASQLFDPDFARFVLGDEYVEMTLDNIARGDPMGVYKSMSGGDLFAYVTLNNVRVALLLYAAGVLTPVIPLFFLMNNMVMLGCFFTFLAQEGVFSTALGVVWIHGTLEIAAIVIAGGAAFRLGWGWIAPGTLSRKAAFVKSARSSVKILMALIPILIVAGLLEGFVTRLTDMPSGMRVLIIGGSLVFLLWYFVALPIRHARRV